MGKTVELREIATARSGDKGANANIGIIAEEPEYYEPMKEQITADRLKDFFDNFVEGEVTRYEMPNFDSLNFILEEALDGGAATSVRIDRQGKAMCETILQMEIELDE
ncbi:MAG: hypothetical protein ABEK50_13730 [bacterium]